MDNSELIKKVNTYLPNRGYIMHGAPRLGGPVRTWPPSIAIEGGGLTDPEGVRHESWSVSEHELGFVVHTDGRARCIETGQWLVHGELRELASIQVVRGA